MPKNLKGRILWKLADYFIAGVVASTKENIDLIAEGVMKKTCLLGSKAVKRNVEFFVKREVVGTIIRLCPKVDGYSHKLSIA